MPRLIESIENLFFLIVKMARRGAKTFCRSHKFFVLVEESQHIEGISFEKCHLSDLVRAFETMHDGKPFVVVGLVDPKNEQYKAFYLFQEELKND